MFRIFLAQQRSAPDVRLATALLQRWIAEPPPADELAGPARELLERLVRATQLRFPVVGDLARSVRFRWFDQPLVDAERSSVLAGVRDEVGGARRRPRRARPGRADRGAGRDPRADRPVPRRAARGRRARAGADARGAGPPPLPRVRPARPARRSCATAGRSRSPTTSSTTARPAWSPPSAPSPSSATRTARWSPPSATRSPPRGAGHEAVVDLYLHWPDAPEAAGARPATELAGVVGALPFAHDVRRVAVAVCPGGGRPVSYFTFRPDRRRRRHRRGRPGPRRAPDGRPPAQPVAAARLRRHPHRGARGRAALRVRGPGEPGRPAARRAGPGAPARRRARRGRAGSPACRTRSARWRTAWRRSGGPARRAARPAASSTSTTSGCRSGRWSRPTSTSSTALQGKITPLTDGAGIEEVLAQGRVRRPGRHAVADRDPVPRPARRRRHGLGRGAADRAAQAARRLRRQGAAGPSPRPGLPLRAGAACSPGPAARLVEYDLDDTGALVPVDRPPGLNKAGILVAVVTTPTDAAPRGRHPGGALRRPDQGARRGRRSRSARGSSRRIDLAERMQVPVEWFALSAGARISMDSGTENMDWVAAGAQADRRVHPGRRRDQRRRRRHQRRRAALLERRGDDADAHQGHPGDDARTARWC